MTTSGCDLVEDAVDRRGVGDVERSVGEDAGVIAQDLFEVGGELAAPAGDERSHCYRTLAKRSSPGLSSESSSSQRML